MFFEQELGIKPAAWLQNPEFDVFLDDNCFKLQLWEEMAVRALGLHMTVIRLMAAALLCIPLGVLHRFVPSTTGRHLYALLTGVALLYYPFGNQVLLIFASSFLIYAVMLLAPKYAGKLSWAIAFPFLLLCMERTGDLWDTGAIDITGSLMVVVLKQIAVAHNLSDGYSAKRYSQERHDLSIAAAPNPLHYFSYLFASGNLLAGPFFEYPHYKQFMARQGEWSKAFTAPMFEEALRASARCFGVACGALVAEQLVSARFKAAMVLAPAAFKMPLWRRYLVAFATGFARRAQYYFIWALSEASINAQGFGFNGFKDTEGKKPSFDRYNNANVFKVETCSSIALLPKFWNVNTGVFLRRYVYERVGKGFAGLAVTQLVSGLWHGMREGHMIFFFMSIFLFQGSKVWYKQEARLPRSVYESYPWQIFKWFVSHAQLNVYAQPFMLQKWHLCWANARAFHFAPHIFGFALCALGAVLPNPRRKESTNGKRGVSKTD